MSEKDNSPTGLRKDRSFRYKSESSNTIDRSFSTTTLNYYCPFSTVTPTYMHKSTHLEDIYYTKRHQVAIPVYQPYIKVDKKLTNKVQADIFEVQKWMRGQAEEGNLMIERPEFDKFIKHNHQLLTKLEQYGVIHTTIRQFGNKSQTFHSLNLDLISHESLLWCLRSLKRDEMTPNEKAVQSRIKEVF